MKAKAAAPAAARKATAKKKAAVKKKKAAAGGGGGGGGGGHPMKPGTARAAAAKKKAAKPAPAQTPRQRAAKLMATAAQQASRAGREEARAAEELKHSAAQAQRGAAAHIRAMMAGIDTAQGKRYQAESASDLKRSVNDRERAKKERKAAATEKARATASRLAAHDTLIGAPAPGAAADGWVLGGNDVYDTCAAAAVANSLLATTGRRVTDRDVMDLHFAVTRGADTWASMGATLAALAERGIGGWHPAGIRWLAGLPPSPDGVIVALPGHAAVLYGPDLITWGAAEDAGEWIEDEALTCCWVLDWAPAR